MLRFLLLLLLGFVVFSCSSESDPAPNEVDSPTPQSPVTPEDPEVEEEPEENPASENFPPAIVASSDLGNEFNEGVQNVELTEDGDIVFSVRDEGDGSSKLYRTNQSFEVQWDLILPDTEIDGLVRTNDGNFVAIGINNLTNPSVASYMIKFSSSGQIIWERNYEAPGRMRFLGIVETVNGDLLVTGTSGIAGDIIDVHYGMNDVIALRFDAMGNVIWGRNYGGSDFDGAEEVIEDEDGSFVIIGFTRSSDFDVSETNSSQLCWVLRIGENGEVLDEESFGPPSGGFSFDIHRLSNGNLVVSAMILSAGGDVSMHLGDDDAWIVLLDPTFNIIAERSIGGSEEDQIRRIFQRSNGNLLLAGFTGSSDGDVSVNNGTLDFWMVEMTTDLEIVEEATFGGSLVESATDAVLWNDRFIVMAGSSSSSDGDVLNNEGIFDPWLILVDVEPE